MEANFRLEKYWFWINWKRLSWVVYHSNLILLDINRDINSVYSGPLDTSFGDTNRDEFNNTNNVGEDSEYDDPSTGEQENESESFCENIRKRKNADDTCTDKVVKNARNQKSLVTKLQEKRKLLASTG